MLLSHKDLLKHKKMEHADVNRNTAITDDVSVSDIDEDNEQDNDSSQACSLFYIPDIHKGIFGASDCYECSSKSEENEDLSTAVLSRNTLAKPFTCHQCIHNVFSKE